MQACEGKCLLWENVAITSTFYHRLVLEWAKLPHDIVEIVLMFCDYADVVLDLTLGCFQFIEIFSMLLALSSHCYLSTALTFSGKTTFRR